jgi:endonuclease-3
MAGHKAVDWSKAIQPLLKKYKKKKHPLDYKNIYQLLVMVILSARDTDDHINKIAPEFFKKYPDMKSLSKATAKKLMPYLGKVRSAFKKIPWLIEIAKTIKTDKNIPLTMESLVDLPGIGRKSANVIMREAKVKAEGIIVDLHVVRVAPRLGITTSTNPDRIEKDMMNALPQKYWSDAGMSVSFLGREICRPKNPKHAECVMRDVCTYYASLTPSQKKKALQAEV